MTKKNRITNKTFLMTAIIGSFLIVAMVAANSIWVSNQAKSGTDEAVSAVSSFYLEAMADRRAKTITNLISNNFDQMEKAVEFIEEENITSQEDLRNTLGRVKSLLGLNRFALVDEDNVVYTQYTTYTGRSRYAFLSEERMDDRIISTASLYGSSKLLCLAIPTPGLSIKGTPFKACFVQIDISDIVDLLAFDDHGRTYFGLYSKNGSNLSGTELGPVISDQNLFESAKDLVTEEILQENIDNFAAESKGSMTFSSGGVKETLCYEPIKGTGWEIAVLIYERVILDQIRNISERNLNNSRRQTVFTLVIVLLFASVLLFQLRSLSKARLEEEKETSKTFQNMANTDSLTGVRNKLAYTEYESKLNQQIRDNEIDKLAVVVCDINGLKNVNDTQGHAAGDQLIKDACALICDYFTHGTVFRIGGDEFAVILQRKGYDTMSEVISDLNHKVEANIEEKAVVVSIGYSVLEKQDQMVRDVFERADQMMYERKKELKAMGAPTRNV